MQIWRQELRSIKEVTESVQTTGRLWAGTSTDEQEMWSVCSLFSPSLLKVRSHRMRCGAAAASCGMPQKLRNMSHDAPLLRWEQTFRLYLCQSTSSCIRCGLSLSCNSLWSSVTEKAVDGFLWNLLTRISRLQSEDVLLELDMDPGSRHLPALLWLLCRVWRWLSTFWLTYLLTGAGHSITFTLCVQRSFHHESAVGSYVVRVTSVCRTQQW